MTEARYLHPRRESSEKPAVPVLECSLCPHRCRIPDGKAGICRVRENRGGRPFLPYYGLLSSVGVDPMEKKPLYHFRPGTDILSVGFWGCNLRCPFCQNWSISQTAEESGRRADGAALVEEGRRAGLDSIAYTYSEPLVHFEFLMETMETVRKAGMANVLITNGCILEEPAREILALTDAANVDLKAFSRDTYRKTLGGDLDAVLGFIRMAADLQVHLEVTTLVVPGLNDGEEELDRCIDFLVGISKDIPWHLSAYHPSYRWDAPPTDGVSLLRTARRAAEKLNYVYVGNLAAGESNTLCSSCGTVLVRRRGYSVDLAALAPADSRGNRRGAYRCAACGAAAPFTA